MWLGHGGGQHGSAGEECTEPLGGCSDGLEILRPLLCSEVIVQQKQFPSFLDGPLLGVLLANTGLNKYLVPRTLRSLINVQSVINVQGDKFSKKNKRTGVIFFRMT